MESPSNSVQEASNSEVKASWRGAEAVEASHKLHMDSNQLDLSWKFLTFQWILQVSVIFCCDLEEDYVKVLKKSEKGHNNRFFSIVKNQSHLKEPFDNDKNCAKMNAGRFHNTYLLLDIRKKHAASILCIMYTHNSWLWP